MTRRSTQELLEAYTSQQQMHNFEGRKGVENLCLIARVLGYKDSTYFGQLTPKSSIGDLIAMLEDNSGLIEAMIDWIGSKDVVEFREPLEQVVSSEPDEDEDETDY